MQKILKKNKSSNFYWLMKFINNCKNFINLRKLNSYPNHEKTNKSVLIFSSISMFSDHLIIDSALSSFLKKNNAKVRIVLCDRAMPICHVSDRYSYSDNIKSKLLTKQKQKAICDYCINSKKIHGLLSNEEQLNYSEGIDFFIKSSFKDPVITNLNEYIDSGIIRFSASSENEQINQIPDWIKKDYENAAISSYKAIFGLISKYEPDIVIGHHGIYVPQGLVQMVSKKLKKTFYSWHFGYRKKTLIFSKGDTYHKEMIFVPNKNFSTKLKSFEKKEILDYLKSRHSGKKDWIYFNRNSSSVNFEINKNKTISLFTSVDWDAALHFPSSVYKSQFDFLSDVIEIFKNYLDLNLIIRIHPAEITGSNPAYVSSEDYIRKLNPSSNVKIISSSSKVSSYEIAQNSKAVIVYNTKMGIELPPLGIPVIVAGDSWIRGKGFSYDVNKQNSLDSYIRNIDDLFLSEEQIELSIQFAHYFYFKRCIQVDALKSAGKSFQINFDKSKLYNDKFGFDFITKKILKEQDICH